jgi:hypothetical protein
MSQDQNLFSKISLSVLDLTSKKIYRKSHTDSECLDCYFKIGALKIKCGFCDETKDCVRCGGTANEDMSTECPQRILNAWELRYLKEGLIDFKEGKWEIKGKKEDFETLSLSIPDGNQSVILTMMLHLSRLYRSSSDPNLENAIESLHYEVHANTLLWSLFMSENISDNDEESAAGVFWHEQEFPYAWNPDF